MSSTQPRLALRIGEYRLLSLEPDDVRAGLPQGLMPTVLSSGTGAVR